MTAWFGERRLNEICSKLLFIALIGSATGSALATAQRNAAWVDKRVAELQPTADERKIDQIGWAADIRTALALGKAHNRPVFLFTHDGRMGAGRC